MLLMVEYLPLQFYCFAVLVVSTFLLVNLCLFKVLVGWFLFAYLLFFCVFFLVMWPRKCNFISMILLTGL